ncbi:hypothetical protein BN1708_001494 [Verticillium longisporum]|uniref:Uncharacterized protein n=1 Tax=Verticillium longisporum TaxID=100787 RepID=A0A0G4MT74_VERLO|nr:hypothetical protein BN1708_001494 [Verticillium longisporum]
MDPSPSRRERCAGGHVCTPTPLLLVLVVPLAVSSAGTLVGGFTAAFATVVISRLLGHDVFELRPQGFDGGELVADLG